MIQDLNDITSFKWATVHTVNPIIIQLDGDSAPLAMLPDSLVDPATLKVGDRVRVELSGRKCVIHGKVNGFNRNATKTATSVSTWTGVANTWHFYKTGGMCWVYITAVLAAAWTPGNGTVLGTLPAGFECAQQHYVSTGNPGLSIVSVNGTNITSAGSGTAASGSRFTILDSYPAANQ